ncbi:MAG: hypothetical protein KAH44_17250, partial [Oricola sp.]|nr:hypothetical protein [Oricola sp.]
HFGKYSDYSLIHPMGWREFSKFVNALSKKTYSEYSTSRNLVGLIQDRSDVIRFYESIGANVVEQFGSQEKLAALDDNAIGAFRQLVRKASASVSANGATTPNRLEAEAFCAIAENYCAAMGMGWRGKLRDVTDSVGRAKFESTLRAYDKEAARHKFSLILSFPLLAKVFGFCFDIKVPISFLEERSNGLIAVDLHQDDIKPSANRLTWTAYEGSAAQSLFRPWAGHFGDEASKEVFGEQYSGGLVNFGQQIRKARRFRLGQAGPANDFRAAIATAEFVAKQFDEGRIPASGVEPLIERRRRGIVIYDMFAGIAKKLELLREGEQEGAAVAQPTINYERDLVRGVRLDVQVGETSHSWSPLMARHVAFTLHDTERDAAFQRLIKKPEYRNYADREEGYCTQLISTDRSTEDEQEASEIWVAPDELAVWSGDSMALSGSQGEEGVEQEIKVPFQVQLSLPEEVSRQPAPLRDRSCYSFRGRLAYANGCGQPFEAELSGWNAEAHLLTGDDGRPYRYARSETVEPPDVLLPEDCALVRARDVDDLDAQAPGESVDCIVVRSSGTARRKKATRILLPPRATWEQAERQRQFDDSDDAEAEKALLGAFRERLAIAACGGLPEARGGAVVLRNMEKLAGNDVEREFEFKNDYKVLSGPKHHGKKFDSQQSRGPVFAGGNGIKHRGAFFADADGHTLRWRIAAARDGVNVAASEAATMSAQPEARFWEDGVQKPYEAKPIRLDVVAD